MLRDLFKQLAVQKVFAKLRVRVLKTFQFQSSVKHDN